MVSPVLSRSLSSLLAAVAALIAAVALSLSPAHAQQVFDKGHVDAFYVTAEGGGLKLGLKEDVTGSGVVHAGDDVEFRFNV